MYGIIFANFAVSYTIRDPRAEYARLSHTTGFFYAVKSTLYKELRLPNLTASFLQLVHLVCLLYSFNDKGGSRFLFCPHKKLYKMKKKQAKRTTAQLIKEFKENFIQGEAAGDYAKHLRITCATALQNPDPPLDRVLSVLYLAEFLQDIATSFLIPNSHIPNSKILRGVSHEND